MDIFYYGTFQLLTEKFMSISCSHPNRISLISKILRGGGWLFILCIPFLSYAHETPKPVTPGIERLLSPTYLHLLKGKKVGLLTNHTAVNAEMQSSIDLLKAHAKKHEFQIVALFAPEHGINGAAHASESVKDQVDVDGIPIFSLHGATQRPSLAMLKNVEVMICDMQDIGSRSYTYITTLFYMMEEAAKAKVPVIITDRPNPINGVTIDGPLLEEQWRSMVGYINVPYCYGMTIGELAKYFNEEYHVGCQLQVIPMEGWKRWMSFEDTHLPWIPTSPHIPEATTPTFYPMTGIIGELQMVSIGVGYTLPFKLIGAPWIDAMAFAKQLNAQKLPGIYFSPFYFKPFYGKFAKEECQGVLIVVHDHLQYQPVTTQYVIIGLLKSLYPQKFQEAMEASKGRKEMFCKVNGTDKIYTIMKEKKHFAWEIRTFQQDQRDAFRKKREKYLLPQYL